MNPSEPAAVPSTMRTTICDGYGPPDRVRGAERPTPTPSPGEVLIRIVAASVSSADWRLRTQTMPRGFGLMGRLAFGVSRPRQPTLGGELSGVVVATGTGATRFRQGDEVIAYTGARLGCHAEYRALPEAGAIIAKPAALAHVEAAALSFGGCTALHFLRDCGRIKKGDRAMIIGASGSVGSAALQLARHFGAETTAVCSGANQAFALGLGADHALDYAADDFSRPEARYDIVLDAVGATTFAQMKNWLAPDGRFLMVAASLPEMLRALTTVPARRKAIAGFAGEKAEDMRWLADLAAAGVWRPPIDSVYPLADIAAAHARVETRRKRGNVVVTMEPALA